MMPSHQMALIVHRDLLSDCHFHWRSAGDQHCDDRNDNGDVESLLHIMGKTICVVQSLPHVMLVVCWRIRLPVAEYIDASRIRAKFNKKSETLKITVTM